MERREVSGARQSRRRFLAMLAGVVAAVALDGERAWAAPARRRGAGKHPEPRPGIDASRVLPRERLAEHPDAIPVFDMVRQIPRVVDGIGCQCGCAETPGYYSLLSCYEGEGMAQHCSICQGQARLAYTMHRDGKTLDQIRAAIDAN